MVDSVDYRKIAYDVMRAQGMPEDRIFAIDVFMPHVWDRVGEAFHEGYSFAHYTTADTAVKLFDNGQFWMRNALMMNDASEIEYGLTLLGRAHRHVSNDFAEIYRELFGGDLVDIISHFDSEVWKKRGRTWLGSLSAHWPERDPYCDEIGRLSMWRAYGGNAGVAIVIDPKPLLQAMGTKAVVTVPVVYAKQQDIDGLYHGLVARIKANKAVIKTWPRQIFDALLTLFYDSILVGTKHPGFLEEREWRLVHRPDIPFANAEPLPFKVETIRGVPQVVYKLDIKKGSSGSAGDYPLDTLIKRVIVGPCERPVIVIEALLAAMRGAGMTNPESLIVNSEIPLRHNY